jgi:flagellar hook-associated protein 3 FlgL
MLTNLDPSSELFLADIDRIQQRLQTVSRQVSSGKRITKASDAPDEIAPLLQLRANLQRNQQIQANLAVAKTADDTAEGAISAAAKLMDRALTLAAQGMNFTAESSRQSLAGDVQSLQEQMLAYSRTAVDGRFIFTGNGDTQPAYAQDLTAVNGVTRLSGAPVTRQVENPAGGSFVGGLSAQDIFDHRNTDDSLASDNVFAAINGLRTALLNNDTAGIQTALSSIKSAGDHLNTSLAFYGNMQNRIADATDYAGSYGTRIQTEISQKEDTDVAAAAVELTQANTQLQAAFQMHANMKRHSLFEYIG